ncbi:MAG: RNA polymerase sigma factor [Bacteroidota bacterium]
MQELEQRNIFNQWIGQYKALLFKVLRAYAFTPADQEDLFQEIAIQLWRSIPAFGKRSSETTWIYKVALNTALNWTRKERKHQEGRESIPAGESILQTSDQVSDERLVWLYEQIALMHELDRSLCLLMLDGFSHQEMSQILGLSESNIGVKLHRIKKQLTAQAKKLSPHEL